MCIRASFGPAAGSTELRSSSAPGPPAATQQGGFGPLQQYAAAVAAQQQQQQHTQQALSLPPASTSGHFTPHSGAPQPFGGAAGAGAAFGSTSMYGGLGFGTTSADAGGLGVQPASGSSPGGLGGMVSLSLL